MEKYATLDTSSAAELLSEDECLRPDEELEGDLIVVSPEEGSTKLGGRRRRQAMLGFAVLVCVFIGIVVAMTLYGFSGDDESKGINDKLRPPFTVKLCSTDSKSNNPCWPEGQAPSFAQFFPQPHDGLPRNGHYRYTGLDTWISKGMDLEKALRAMLGDRTIVFETFLFQYFRAYLLGHDFPDPFKWSVQTKFEDTDNKSRRTAVLQGIRDAGEVSKLLFKQWKHHNKSVLTEEESYQVAKQLLPLFDTSRRLKEFLGSLTIDVSDQPIDLIYSSIFSHIAAEYGNEVVIIKPEQVPRSMDLNFYNWGRVVKEGKGEFVTPTWIDADEIAGFQFYGSSEHGVSELEYSLHLVEDNDGTPYILVFDGRGSSKSVSYGLERRADGDFVYLSSEWIENARYTTQGLIPYNPLEKARAIGYICVRSSSKSTQCEKPISKDLLSKYGSNPSCSQKKKKDSTLSRLQEKVQSLKLRSSSGALKSALFTSLC